MTMLVRGRKGFNLMPKGPITLEKLAAMVEQGFSSMQEYMDMRFTALEARVSALELRMDKIEAEVAAIRRQLHHAIYQPEFVLLEKRVSALERKANSQFK